MSRKGIADSGKAEAEWTIEKYHGDFKSKKEIIEKGVKPFEVVRAKRNILLAEGIQQLLRLAIGESGLTPYNNANARIGVGDGTVGASRDQTGLQGTNKAFAPMDSGYPVVEQDTSVSPSTYRVVFQATFGGDVANFTWNEATVVNAPDDTGQNLNRLVGSFGTKASGQTWVATCRIRLT